MFPDQSVIDDAHARRLLEAARGYLELEMPQQALEEIRPLERSHGRTSAFAEVALIHIALNDWERALDASLRLRARRPEHPGSWFQSAFCLHELGRTEEALITLDEAPRALRQEALWHYNRGCYLAVLQRPQDALPEVKKAINIEPERFKKSAKTDPDLISISHLL
jgi:tetratricopeptide (TPR) repeat protein